MHKYIRAFVLSTLCLLFLTAARPLPEFTVTTIDSPWLSEAEFAADDSLHATHSQTIVLDLESSGKGKGAIRRNSVRFLVEEEQNFSFCIPDDEPHMLRIKLKRAGGRTLMNGRRGGNCKAVELEPGRYELDIFHDGRSVGAAGKKAFLHRPARRRHRRSLSNLGASEGGTLQEELTLPTFFALSGGTNALGTTYPTIGTSIIPYRMILTVDPNGVRDDFVWSFYEGATDMSGLTNSRPMAPTLMDPPQLLPLSLHVVIYGEVQTSPFTIDFEAPTDCHGDNYPNDMFCTFSFILNDAGDGLYFMWADNYGLPLEELYPWIVGRKGSTPEVTPVQVSGVRGDSPAPPNALFWDFTFIGYPDTTTMPELQEGEFAVFGECGSNETAFVFDGDVDLDQFSAMTQQQITPPSSIKAIKLGPSTFLEISKDGVKVADFGVDVTCASEPIDADQITVFIDVLKFIAATNTCRHCNLTGMDFSGDDFSGVDFTGVILNSANLTGTNLTDANLTDADLLAITGANGSSLSGTIFTGATLACTSFKGSLLSDALFGSNTLTTDRSCHVDLSGATLDFDTFAVTDWRYFDLSSSSVNNVPDVLSAKSAPLDLSGAILSNVEWLQGLQLDHVNLGCYAGIPDARYVCPAPSGESHCATLQGTVLTGASLKYACMSSASMEGSFLGYSNLDGADLSGARLKAVSNADGSGSNVTTLEGAFMRNVNLSGADMTGVTASNVSLFYTGSAPEASAENLTAPGANFSNSYLVGVDFTGSDGMANLQGTNWSGANLVGANFSNTDLGTNTSGGVNSGSNTNFSGAYLHSALFDQAVLENVDFTNTYWDAGGLGGKLNFLMPAQNLEFTGYWKDISSPDCPPPSGWDAGTLPPMHVTDGHNTCPDNNPGPCDDKWDQPKQDISLAFFRSADATTEPPTYPQVPGVDPDDQCGGANNPKDLCWTHADDPPPTKCLPN